MTEWLYKATRKKLDLKDMKALTTEDGFICRSARGENGRWVANVRRVAIGDLIHVYFRTATAVLQPLGAFEVILRERHPARECFGSIVDGTALHRVFQPEFLKKRDPEEVYQPDPVVGVLTGWLVERVADAADPDPDFAKNTATLVARPGPDTATSFAEPEADAEIEVEEYVA